MNTREVAALRSELEALKFRVQEIEERLNASLRQLLLRWLKLRKKQIRRA